MRRQARILAFIFLSLVGLQSCGTQSEIGPGARICAVDETQACTCADTQEQGCQVCEVEEGLRFNECDCGGNIDCRDGRALFLGENQHRMTATIDDSDVPFEAKLQIMIVPVDYDNESWRVDMSANLRSTVVAPPDLSESDNYDSQHGNIAFTEGFSEEQSPKLFIGGEKVVLDGGAFTYPTGVDGTWLTREIESVMIDLEDEREMRVIFGLGPKIHITEDDVWWEETGSSVVELRGPPAVSCQPFREPNSPNIISDTLFESDFCRDALADLGLTEWMVGEAP